ncbi:hypothetical protein SAMN04490248_11638 [Salinihabitans flavidus]|uniref:Uncharacterized protein n=1 Tax=Salinihabitans flavidus TaxID=569882 RepID=A0A1H8TPI2_9RHOB|nr:hypothetical protein [Salinihabitans flavidus]SEO92368.1 hypothetical protein SAMN04490248_11638 [Salinihabitans flavidus]
MKYGWKALLGVLWVSCLAGATLIVFLALGWYSPWAFAAAGAVGLVFGIPAGIWNARKLRRDDPNWKNGRYVKAPKGLS